MPSRKVLRPTILGLFRVVVVVGLAKLTHLGFTRELRDMIKVKGFGIRGIWVNSIIMDEGAPIKRSPYKIEG